MIEVKNSMLIIVMFFALLLPTPGYTQGKEVTFDNGYIAANDGKTTVEIAEAQELIYIILSLTPTAQQHPVMVNRQTSYYTEVSQHFSKYAQQPVVAEFDSLLRQNLVNYFLLAANAYGFAFRGDRLVPTGVYDFPAKGIGKFEITVNPIITYLDRLQDFAKASSFRDFYRRHRDYYQQVRNDYMAYAQIARQKQWLEAHFDAKINSYRVLTSPLIGGMNATHTFEDNKFKEILLFLPVIRDDKQWDEQTKRVTNTRIIFTEIDHNYVGPVSADHLEAIGKSVANRTTWVDTSNKGTDHYPNPLKIFDEYLTWGLFLLYCHDTYPENPELLSKVTAQVNEMMAHKRGFIRAAEFNETLLKLYVNSDNKRIASLYPQLLAWCAGQ